MPKKDGFEVLFKKYIHNIQKTSVSDKTEHTDRSYLKDLIENLSTKNLSVIHEPKRSKIGLGSPDFHIKKGENTIGYIEVKKMGEDLTKIINSEQIQKYKKIIPNLIITNYFEFIWIHGETIQKASLLLSSKRKVSDDNNYSEVNKLLENFLSTPTLNIRKASDLAKALAPKCREIKDFLVTTLIDQNNKKDGFLFDLYQAFKERVFRDLRSDEFANVFAQMIIYGLFLSRLQSGGKVQLNYSNAKKYIPKSFELIQQLVGFLDKLEEEDYLEIKWIVDEVFEIINTFDYQSIQKDLAFSGKSAEATGIQIIEKDPYVHFYEDFLKEYDNKLRREMGVYYTPLPIVKFIVKGIGHILKKTFGLKQGLADKKVTALDFAVGTGTFLIEVFEQILAELPLNSGKLNDTVKHHLLQNFYGFEFMIAPYTIAHLKLSEFLKEKGYVLNKEERLGVYLTNTLESLNTDQPSLPGLNSLTEEGIESQKVKKKPILVILGNPPYSGVSRNNTPGLIDAYKEIDGKPLNEKKHWLNDDYVKFIRFAELKMSNVSEGVFGVITNNGFLDNPTFRGMRASLLKTFDQIFIINLHGNAKKKETCLDGSKDQNVFDIQQGVCITFFVKKKEVKKEIFYTDWQGMREDKYRKCLNETLDSIKWQILKPQKDSYLFIPQQEINGSFYNQGWAINKIFSVQSTGIVTARDKLATNFSSKELLDNMNDFHDLSITDEEISSKYNVKDNYQWKLNVERRKFANKKISEESVVDINYRPFDIRKIYLDKLIVFRDRQQVMQHILARNNMGLIFNKNDQGAYSYNHAFVSNTLSDGHMQTGMAYFAPLFLFDDDNLLHNSKTDNFQPAFRKYIYNLYKGARDPEIILGYIYGILYCSIYRTRYLQFLKMDFPRITFSKDIKLFEKMSKLGNDLIQAHLLKDIPDYKLGSYIGKGKNNVEKIVYDSKTKKLLINSSQYFENISEEIWIYSIGGYQVLDKYLKSRKGRILKLEEIEHIENVVNVLAFTIEQMRKIDKVYQQIDLT
jgi:hypothetical protein